MDTESCKGSLGHRMLHNGSDNFTVKLTTTACMFAVLLNGGMLSVACLIYPPGWEVFQQEITEKEVNSFLADSLLIYTLL